MVISEIITPKIFAAATQINLGTVYRWENKRRLPPFDLNVGRPLLGWKIDTLKKHDPLLATLIEDYLAAAREESPT